FGFLNKEEVLGKTARELNLISKPEQREELTEMLRKYKVVKNFEIESFTRQGASFWISTSIIIIEVENEPCLFSISVDISNRKKAESEVRQLNHFLDTILENIPNMVFVKDADELRFVRFNKAGEKLLGYSRNDLIGKNDYDFFPKEQADFFTVKDREALDRNNVTDIAEEKIKTSTGELWLHTKKIPVANESGKVVYLLGISEDITEQKKAREELLELNTQLGQKVAERTNEVNASEKKFRALIENSADAISMVSENAELLYLSLSFERLFGYTLDDLKDKHPSWMIHPEDAEKVQDVFMNAMKNPGIPQYSIHRLRHKTKEWVYVEGTMSNMLNNKNVKAIVSNFHDITERKNSEEKIKKYTVELERSNKELEQFAYIASHDLQEPLRMVGSYMQLLQKRYKDKLDEDANEFIYYAVDGAMRMKQLINDLLNYSRTNKEGELSNVIFTDVLNDVIQNLKTSIEENNVIINFANMPVIYCDRTQMIQLFQNLISNSIKFKKDDVDPIININAEKVGPNWLFSLEDNGIGIEAQYSDKIFIIFKQLHDKSKYKGTGIGLAIAKKIVERHEGKIWFESTPGNGTTFYFTIKA
ncbi:MAG: PAS domain S-box protein, partial [Bacteroidia bacterium]|nr:PAS domain S-box protein [Bacteroidia bacterium]